LEDKLHSLARDASLCRSALCAAGGLQGALAGVGPRDHWCLGPAWSLRSIGSRNAGRRSRAGDALPRLLGELCAAGARPGWEQLR